MAAFESKMVINFLNYLSDSFCTSLDSIFTEFKNHSEPIVINDELQNYCYWLFECDTSGIHFKKRRSKSQSLKKSPPHILCDTD